MNPYLRQHPNPVRRIAGWLAVAAVGLVASVGCAPPGIGTTSPYRGEASFNASTSNFEGRMVACTANGGPVTVSIDPNAGFDQEHPFLVELKNSNQVVLGSRSVFQPTDVFISPPLLLGTCFEVQITSPGAIGRAPFIFTVTW